MQAHAVLYFSPSCTVEPCIEPLSFFASEQAEQAPSINVYSFYSDVDRNGKKDGAQLRLRRQYLGGHKDGGASCRQQTDVGFERNSDECQLFEGRLERNQVYGEERASWGRQDPGPVPPYFRQRVRQKRIRAGHRVSRTRWRGARTGEHNGRKFQKWSHRRLCSSVRHTKSDVLDWVLEASRTKVE